MEHIVKTYILLLFSLLVSSIGYAQEENDIIYIQEGKWGVILCGERGYAWLDNKGDTTRVFTNSCYSMLCKQ